VTDAFDVVFVCTGNRFRSPIAAATFAAETAGRPVRVRSFGTLELGGAPALDEAVRLSSAVGLDLTAHRSRCLDEVRLDEADLVIGFETKHVARAVVDAGARRERTFLLGELVEILEAGVGTSSGTEGAGGARDAVARADEKRDHVSPPTPIGDPYGGPAAGYERAASSVRDLTRRLAAALFPPS
jgi:low molecular weight protein-tyrosine phosphatase